METQLGPKSHLGAAGSSVFWNSGRHQFGGHCQRIWLLLPSRPFDECEQAKEPLAPEEKDFPDQANLAKAVLAQSLHNQIAAAGQDPMTDLSTPGAGTSTRIAQGDFKASWLCTAAPSSHRFCKHCREGWHQPAAAR